MNDMLAYHNTIWLADGERFPRYINLAKARPCPTREQVLQRHRENMQLAKDLPGQAFDAGSGVIADAESELLRLAKIPACPKCGSIDYETTTLGVDEWNVFRCACGMKGPVGDLEPRADAPKAIRAVKGKVGVICIFGPMDQRLTAEMEKAGGTPLDFVSRALDSLLGNAAIGAIVLLFDSPGGSIYGVEELSDKIFAARDQKPIYAMVDSLMCSAAYWIGTAASMVICTPGGICGSVGCYIMHIDESKALEDEGLKVTMVSAGKYKVEHSSHTPLTDEAKADLQGRVDAIYDKFTLALKRNRATSIENVRQNYGQGRVLMADDALRAGMVDRVMTFDELIGKLTGGTVTAGTNQSQAAAMTRIQLQHDRRRRPAIA